MINQRSEQRHPFSALFLLLLLALTGVVIFTTLAVFIGTLIYRPESFKDLLSGNNIGFQKLMLALSSIGMFIIPALFFAYRESGNARSYLKLYMPKPLYLVLLALIVMICSTPFLEWTIFINQQMKLPGILEEVERWMRNKEDELAELTKSLLLMKNIPALALNIIVIALIPALGEELTFRGCIQQIFSRWAGNKHLGIWIAAIIFSAIHVQFYGFIPRMLLGAMFGYLFVWTKSIWVPVTAHFYNNASAVVTAYTMQKQGTSLDTLTEPADFKWYWALASLILTALLLWIIKRITFKTPKNIYHEQ